MSHCHKYYFSILLDNRPRQLDNSTQLGFRSSQESNINREEPPSFCTLFTQASSLEREEEVCWKERRSYLRVLHCLGWVLYKGSFVGFSPLWFPRGKSLFSLWCCACCACCSFSDPTIVNCFRISSKQLRKTNMVSEPPWKETLCS